jgi:aminoglycoside phosphotransferase (APT) family kinase protein
VIPTTDEPFLIDLTERATAAARSWHDGAKVVGIERLTGGASSLTFTASFEGVAAGEAQVVLKVAPPGLEPVRNRDVLRQARLMRALADQPGVAVPAVYFDDPGDPPAVPPFVAMRFVAGECVEPTLDEARDPARFAQVRARSLHAARVLAAMHRVDPAAVGLAGEPVVSLAEEIDRWTRAFATVPAELQGDYQRCADALHVTMPPALDPVVVHGDYRLGNTLCEGDRVAAVIDWELWALGDPRVDLTWLTFFTDDAHHPASPSDEPSGTPQPAELLAAYTAAYGESFPDMAWFEALTRYKEAAASALLIKRGRKAGQMVPGIERMVPGLPVLLEEAHQLIG